MTATCGCCEGTQLLTPQPVANRPGLDALAYRVGTHAAFLETMKARLANFRFDALPGESDAAGRPQLPPPLAGLMTRAADDPAIALMDAWATVADVLTFYQERIANEGYLRTATERRSILELARLVGYALRPGVASTVFLAYTLDENSKEPVTIPRGARVTSVPGPGETPQSFETVEEIEARAAWNLLKPRMTRPQTQRSISDSCANPRVFLQGIGTNLKPNDPLLIQFGQDPPVFVRVKDVQPDALADRTLVTLQRWPKKCPNAAPAPEPLASPEAITADAKRQLSAIVARYLGEEVKTRGLSRGTQMFGRTSDYLGALEQQLEEAVSYPALLVFLNDETMPKLEAKRQTAETKGYTDLEPWLAGLIAELRSVAATTTSARADALAHAFALATQPMTGTTGAVELADPFNALPTGLETPPSVPPRNALALDRDLNTAFQAKADTLLKALGALRPDLREALPTVAANTKVAQDVTIKVYALRVTAAPFGHNAQPIVARFVANPASGTAPLRVQFTSLSSGDITSYHWTFGDGTSSLARDPSHTFTSANDYTVTLTVSGPAGEAQAQLAIQVDEVIINVQPPVPTVIVAPLTSTAPTAAIAPQASAFPHSQSVLFLDADYNISPQSLIAISADPDTQPNVFHVDSVSHETLNAYGLSGKSTRLGLSSTWFTTPPTIDVVHRTNVYALSEELPLAEEPIDQAICTSGDPASPSGWIELDDLYSGLQAGRWLIVSGERTDITAPDPGGNSNTKLPVPGVLASELVMLAEVTQRVEETAEQLAYGYGYGYGGKAPAPGEKTHTYLRLKEPLAFCYRRDTVKIYGNVVKATHGETRQEVLGSGDGSKAFQAFPLKQPPLTYVAASTPSGAESTLHVRVNGVEWREAGSLVDLGPTDRQFMTRTDDDNKTTVLFGDGRQGARPPTGIENIKAVYRTGIGQAGNVKPGQISQLVTRPLGVKEVLNPQRASGGADRESRDQARKNAPLAVMALDRLVSTQDYADFARTFAGIGKASAVRLSDGRRQLVHVTIAGVNDIPIDKTPGLYGSLVKALRQFGDPHQAIQVDVRELMLIVLSANVCILPDYQWESVVPKVRARLLDVFSFERRELGQDVILSEIVSTIQAVEGVAYVDVDKLRGVPEKDAKGQLLTPKAISDSVLQPITLPEPLSRLSVNMTGVTNGVIRPAQLAYLTPDVEATLILNEVKA